MDDELRQQMRDVTGEGLETCSICGRATAQPHLVAVDQGATRPEPVEPIRVCDSCLGQIERGEIRIPGSDDSLGDDLA